MNGRGKYGTKFFDYELYDRHLEEGLFSFTCAAWHIYRGTIKHRCNLAIYIYSACCGPGENITSACFSSLTANAIHQL